MIEPILILLLLVLIPLVIASEQEKHGRVERTRVSCDPWSCWRSRRKTAGTAVNCGATADNCGKLR